MAEQPNIASLWPAPPPFYRSFTKQNLAQLRQARKDAGVLPAAGAQGSGDQRRDIDVLSLPPELRYLIPPPPPSDGQYKSFGADINLDAPDQDLETAGIEQLVPSHPSVRLNPQPHLIALARSSLTTFLALTGTLSRDPTRYEAQAQDLRIIMYNIHHLINQYRPHQARETLILMMEERVAKMREEIAAVDEAKERVAKILQEIQDNGLAQTSQVEEEASEDVVKEDKKTALRKARQRAAWQALELEMG